MPFEMTPPPRTAPAAGQRDPWPSPRRAAPAAAAAISAGPPWSRAIEVGFPRLPPSAYENGRLTNHRGVAGGSFYSDASSFYFGDNYDSGARTANRYGQSLAPLPGEGSDRHILSIMTSDNNWVSLAFSTGDDLEQVATQWLQQRGLNPAFKPGLLAQMRQMANTKLITASVDIVDLL